MKDIIVGISLVVLIFLVLLLIPWGSMLLQFSADKAGDAYDYLSKKNEPMTADYSSKPVEWPSGSWIKCSLSNSYCEIIK